MGSLTCVTILVCSVYTKAGQALLSCFGRTENSPSPSCRNQESNPGHWMYSPYTSQLAPSSCSVYSCRSHFEHRKGPNLTSSWLDPFLNLALGDTLISVFLWSFPRHPHLCFWSFSRHPHLCFSSVVSQTPSFVFFLGHFRDTLIFVFLGSFPRHPHLCFSWVISQTPSSVFFFDR